MTSPSRGSSSLPKSFQCFKQYNLQIFLSDLVAGVTVGLVALPLAMAFAISSGVAPQAGIYTAIVAGFIISAFGGSRTQIGGPTGAFVVVVSGIIAKYGIDGLYMCTLMAGVILVGLGITGLGSAVKFFPRPVIVGFTNGIAVLIASTQIRDFFGLKVDHVPGDFLPRLSVLWQSFNTFSLPSTCLSVGSLLLIIVAIRMKSRVPGTLIALFAGSVVAWLLSLPVETIGTRFGGIPSGLPRISVPEFRPELILPLLSPTLTVAMLGAIESLLSAVVADKMSNDRHDPNVELVAQGFANVLSPLFGGLPATGAIARTATNIRSGAKTPAAGMIHAITLLLVLLVAAPLARAVPLPVLAAILMIVSYNMGDWGEIREILKLGRPDILVWVITFGLTVLADLTAAVEAGIILASLLYIRRVTATTTVARVTPEYVEAGRDHCLQLHPIPAGVALYRVHGPFLFGATDKLKLVDEAIDSLPNVVVLRMRNMTAIDGTGLSALEDLADSLRATGRTLILCGMRDQPKKFMQRAEFHHHIGEENFQPSLVAAIQRAKSILEAPPGSKPQ